MRRESSWRQNESPLLAKIALYDCKDVIGSVVSIETGISGLDEHGHRRNK
jgi:hypothetical protein